MMSRQLILVPGLLNDAELFRDQISGLSDIVQPVVADITHGETLSDLAAEVLRGADDRFALAGFSLGGIVAQEVMRIAPERVTHLALMDTTMLEDDPQRAAERRHLTAMARNAGNFHGFGEKLLQTYLAPENLSNHAMVARVRGMTERLGAKVFIRQSLIDRPDGRATLRTLECPVLVLCGEHDALTTPALHRDMAIEIPGSQLVIVPGAGHLAPIEQPDAVNRALRQLLMR